MKYFDFHTHAFVDSLAERAVGQIAALSGDIRPHTDGTLNDLLRAMRDDGVNASVIASIATKASQFEPIVEWSKQIKSEHVFPFASVHPDDPDPEGKVQMIVDAGLKGLKIHPFYQNAAVDDPKWFRLYDAWQDTGLPILFHTGFDVAFPELDICTPLRFRKVFDNFPKLVIVMAHMGGWICYEDFLMSDMCGENVFIDTSCSARFCPIDLGAEIVNKHGAENILFATDCPWGVQSEHIEFVMKICPDERGREDIFYRNAERILGIKVTDKLPE